MGEEEIEIYSELSQEEIKEVLAISQRGKIADRCRILWNLFNELEGNEVFMELKRKVKFGFKLGFDIRQVTEGEVEEYLDSNQVRIKGCEKIDIVRYRDELEQRCVEMKIAIRGLYNPFGNQKETEVKGHG